MTPKHVAAPVSLNREETFVSLMDQYSTGSIELSFERCGLYLDVKWPVTNAVECAQLIRPLLKKTMRSLNPRRLVKGLTMQPNKVNLPRDCL